jgi:hypothetical protein
VGCCTLDSTQVYNIAGMDDIQRVQLFREISIHSRLQHSNVVQFLAAFLVSGMCCILTNGSCIESCLDGKGI